MNPTELIADVMYHYKLSMRDIEELTIYQFVSLYMRIRVHFNRETVLMVNALRLADSKEANKLIRKMEL